MACRRLLAARAPRLPFPPRPGQPGPARRERGVTAIETAIIMISFIVVASIAAFATLTTGLFAAGETQGTVLGALKKANGSILVRGGATALRGSVDVDADNVILITSTSTDQNSIVQIKFVVNGTLTGNVIDLTPPYTFDSAGTDPDASGLTSRGVMSFTTQNVAIPSAAWTVAFIGSNDGDFILEAREKAEVTLWLQSKDIANNLWDLGAGTGDPFLDSAGELLQTKTQFEIEFDVGGGVVSLGRTTPNSLDPIVLLE